MIDLDFSNEGLYIFALGVIEPIQLADDGPPEGAVVTLSGWGFDSKIYPYVLRKVERVVISREECQKSLNPSDRLGDNVICTSAQGGKGTCFVTKTEDSLC